MVLHAVQGSRPALTAVATHGGNLSEDQHNKLLQSTIRIVKERLTTATFQFVLQNRASYLSPDFVMFFHASCEGLPGQ